MAAAGTGAQEAMSLLDRWGATVTHVIGLGGRDLSDAVDGRMAKLAVAALRDDPGTDAILLVSKPPSERVARAVVEVARAGDTPLVAAMVGLERTAPASASPSLPTLEQGVVAALAAVGLERARRHRRPGGRRRPPPAPASARTAPSSGACSPAAPCATSRW